MEICDEQCDAVQVVDSAPAPALNEASVSFMADGFSAKGLTREVNQDRFRVFEQGFVLCDGMGGLEAGEVFAEAACWKCRELLQAGADVREAAREANDALRALSETLGASGGAAAGIGRYRDGGRVELSLMGDIAAFLVSSAGVRRVEEEPVGSMRRERAISSFAGRSTRESDVRVVECPRFTDEDGCLIVLTDGVWRSLSSRDMQDACVGRSGESSADTARRLVERAMAYGSTDDCSAIVCRAAAGCVPAGERSGEVPSAADGRRERGRMRASRRPGPRTGLSGKAGDV